VEDVAQDVFVQVHRASRSFAGRSSFKTWLYGIALNLCRDQRRRELTEPESRTIDGDRDGVLDTLPDASLDPLQQLQREELAVLVRVAVAQLNPAQRIVLQLRDGEDLSYDEIARVLAVPVGTVRSRLHNAGQPWPQSFGAHGKVNEMDCQDTDHERRRDRSVCRG
jgi:RNA polymerase sigma-70 factor (ECF subfamily)